MDTLGVYVQTPFCESKCSFCNFSSKVAPAAAFDPYLNAVLREILSLSHWSARGEKRSEVLMLPVDTLYFGGGTPSLFGTDRLGRIINQLHGCLLFRGPAEFTLEITPGSAADDFLDAALQLGVNRLSIGAQSFSDQELRAVGRLHTSEETREQVHRARRAGFANLSLDLIVGLPFQTERSWQCSLEGAASLSPEHISVYLFELDEKSRLGKEVINRGSRYHAEEVPHEDFQATCYEVAREFLLGEGYAQYEISNFARPRYESRHNRKYWQLHPYLGLGAGAHSFDGNVRWQNVESPELYQTRLENGESPVAECLASSSGELVEEFFFLGLRQREGVNLNDARARWGQAEVARHASVIRSLARDGWLEERDERVRLAPAAYLVSNEIFSQFLGLRK